MDEIVFLAEKGRVWYDSSKFEHAPQIIPPRDFHEPQAHALNFKDELWNTVMVKMGLAVSTYPKRHHQWTPTFRSYSVRQTTGGSTPASKSSHRGNGSWWRPAHRRVLSWRVTSTGSLARRSLLATDSSSALLIHLCGILWVVQLPTTSEHQERRSIPHPERKSRQRVCYKSPNRRSKKRTNCTSTSSQKTAGFRRMSLEKKRKLKNSAKIGFARVSILGCPTKMVEVTCWIDPHVPKTPSPERNRL